MKRWMPQLIALSKWKLWSLMLWQWGTLLLTFLVARWIAKHLARLATVMIAKLVARTEARWDDELNNAAPGPLRLALTFAIARAALNNVRLPNAIDALIDKLSVVSFIIAAAWFASRVLAFGAVLIEQKATATSEDNHEAALKARALSTQVRVLRRAASTVLGFFALCLALLQFDVVRNVGVSLLASAGVVGIMLGVAAQRSIASLLMGIQLSITQPVRIGDTIVFDGEWGQVEEITLTYVVLRVWDKRRLVIPVTRLLEQPVQNWTRSTPELLGTVFVRADPSVPVERVREELAAILADHPLWDQSVSTLIVSDASDRYVELRAVVSARDGSTLFDLRCDVRERLLRWLQSYEGGRYLPHTRVTVASLSAPHDAQR